MAKKGVKRLLELAAAHTGSAKRYLEFALKNLEEAYEVVPDSEYLRFIDKIKELAREIEKLKKDIEWERQII